MVIPDQSYWQKSPFRAMQLLMGDADADGDNPVGFNHLHRRDEVLDKLQKTALMNLRKEEAQKIGSGELGPLSPTDFFLHVPIE